MISPPDRAACGLTACTEPGRVTISPADHVGGHRGGDTGSVRERLRRGRDVVRGRFRDLVRHPPGLRTAKTVVGAVLSFVVADALHTSPSPLLPRRALCFLALHFAGSYAVTAATGANPLPGLPVRNRTIARP